MTLDSRSIRALLAVLVVAASPAFGQAYPNKPIRMILPLPAGSATDVVARMVGVPLGQSLGVNIVMDNRPGADGGIAGAETARATPDGYTLMFGTNSPLSAVPTMRKKPPYHPLKDFTPIGRVGWYTHFVVVHPSVPVKSLSEFIDYARANPGKLSYATGNTFGILTIAQLQKVAGIKMLHVPYKSDPAALIDIIGGRVQFMYATQGQAATFVREGKVRAIAVTGSKRSPLTPDVPTVAEAGLQVPVLGWGGLVGPAGMPAAIVQRINKDLNAVLLQPKLIEEVSRQGFEFAGSTPAEFGDWLRQQYDFWGAMVKELDLYTY
ncbi:MAG: tripartite tricarboxylate transporter substrate binding protein [Burkholderiales bacterium]|nr:tripartite tricarboxylate transporter substrate binding protein [Burkholderiales bacterium]